MDEWTKEWPTERGYYWFCGYVDRRDDEKALTVVRVGLLAGAPYYSYEGAFLHRGSAGEGVWFPIPSPELPE